MFRDYTYPIITLVKLQPHLPRANELTHWGWVMHIFISTILPTLLQIMACRLFGAKPLSKPMLPYCQLDPTEHISMEFYSKVFIQGNALENVVCEMAAILPWPQWQYTTDHICGCLHNLLSQHLLSGPPQSNKINSSRIYWNLWPSYLEILNAGKLASQYMLLTTSNLAK